MRTWSWDQRRMASGLVRRPYGELVQIAEAMGLRTTWITPRGGGTEMHLKRGTIIWRIVERATPNEAILKQTILRLRDGELPAPSATRPGAGDAGPGPRPTPTPSAVDAASAVAMTGEEIKKVAASIGEGVAARMLAGLDAQVRERVAAEIEKLRPTEIHLHVKDEVKIKRSRKDVFPAEWERILQLTTQRVNVLLVGPTGCGKTFIARKVAEALDLPFASISCSAGMSESQVAGWLLPTGDNGQFEYRESPFISSYENGGVFLFDEIDSADPNMLTFINAALANGHMHVPQRVGKAEVKKHPDFVCLAAANTWGTGGDMQYVGRNQLDAATLDRFAVGRVYMPYSDAVERAICNPDVLAWGKAVRAGIEKHGLRRIMSTRVLRDLSLMTEAYGWTKNEWDQTYFQGWAPQEKVRVAR